MDDLLAQLKQEFEPKRNAQSKVNHSSARKSHQPPRKAGSSKPIEEMLDELRIELESGNRPNRPSSNQSKTSSPANSQATSNIVNNTRNAHKYRERLNLLIEQDYQMQARKREAKLAEIRRQEEARLAEEKRRQQEMIEAQRREELRERRRKEALQEKAKQWLKNLNPRSEEGKWFEEFSYSYENKLQAAIDYLEAMRESGL